jgi:acetaldehyde dehydrogenase (acetylating)
LSLRDRDLISIQEAREAVERASQAQKKFAAFSQEQVDAVVEACADAATAAGEQLARTAVEETGYGNVPDKILKNRLASVDVPRAIRGMKTTGIVREDREKGILEIAEPVGVVAAVIPSTNPTSTTIYKTLISLKARNAVVLSPHPSAMRCICETVSVLERAALKMGAPDGLIVCLAHPTMQGTQELMKNRSVGVILATGGTGLVRAAYSSGRPAYGVGPGNVPAFIERTANVKKAVADIFAGKTFDYGTICSSEQAIVAEESVAAQVLEECKQQGGYFLSVDEIAALGRLVFRDGAVTPNPKIVGRAATVVAEMAGIKVPSATRVLIAKLEGMGREVPLSAEKLSPILAFYSAPNLAAGIELCKRLLQHGGMGHTASIHSQNESAVKEYGLAVPAFRVVVNSSSVHGSIGYSTNLFPAMTLGCGSPGGNITSDNIGPQHLMNIKRVAWESRAVEHRTIPASDGLGRGLATTVAVPLKTEGVREAVMAAAAAAGAGAASVPDRKTIARIVEQVFTSRGIARGSATKVEAGPIASTSLPAAATFAPAAAPTSAPVVGLAASPQRPTENQAAAVNMAEFKLKRMEFTPPPQADVARKPESPKPPQSTSANTPIAPQPHANATVPKPEIQVADFVSESDVRTAIKRGEKIYLGPKTIVTPSARDLADANQIFVVAEAPPSSSSSSKSTAE